MKPMYWSKQEGSFSTVRGREYSTPSVFADGESVPLLSSPIMDLS